MLQRLDHLLFSCFTRCKVANSVGRIGYLRDTMYRISLSLGIVQTADALGEWFGIAHCKEQRALCATQFHRALVSNLRCMGIRCNRYLKEVSQPQVAPIW